jgi:hypothetical protein
VADINRNARPTSSESAAPSTFDPDVADAILDIVADGGSLTAACTKRGIARRTVRSWLERNPEFAQKYETARKLGIDWHVDGLVETARRAEGKDAAGVQAIRLEVDTIRWTAAKLLPSRYGDQLALTGKDGAALIPATREQRLPQLVAVLATLMPGRDNGELFDLAGQLLDRLQRTDALPAPNGGHDG